MYRIKGQREKGRERWLEGGIGGEAENVQDQRGEEGRDEMMGGGMRE